MEWNGIIILIIIIIIILTAPKYQKKTD